MKSIKIYNLVNNVVYMNENDFLQVKSEQGRYKTRGI